MARKHKTTTLKQHVKKLEKTIRELQRLIEPEASKPAGVPARREVEPRSITFGEEPFVPITSAARSFIRWTTDRDDTERRRGRESDEMIILTQNPLLKEKNQ